MTIYLIPTGGTAVALPYMGRGISASPDLGAATHRALGGQRTVDYVGDPRRTYTLDRKYLTADELSILEGLALGAYGPGPHALLDPWRRNMLSANQSSGTDVLASTEGFVAITGTLSTSTTQAHAGLRSLAWAVTAANQRMMQGTLANTTNATPASDTPVLPSTSYTGQVRDRLSTSTGTARLDIYWFTAAGVFISASTGTAVAQSNSAFGSPLTCTATSPSTAALARLSVINTVMGAAQTHYLDGWQLEQASSAGAWVVGTGVPRVAFTALDTSYPLADYNDTSITLQEVG